MTESGRNLAVMDELCGKTPAGGWHCSGAGCLAGGTVCMQDAAAPDPGDVLTSWGPVLPNAEPVPVSTEPLEWPAGWSHIGGRSG